MSAYGLPDWGAPLASLAFAAYDAPATRAVLPHALVLATDAAGAPDFHFVAYRAARAGDGTGHGVLDTRLVAAYDTSGSDMAQPVARCLMRLEWLASDVAASLAAPEPLWWSATGEARVVQRIGQDGIALIENSLPTALPLRVVADVEIDGVAPRAAARADVDTQRLVDTLREETGHAGVAREALRERLARAPETLGVTLRAMPDIDTNTAIAALIDQLRVRVFDFAPSRSADGEAMLALPPADAALPGRLTFDLSATCVAPRPLRLELAPFDEAARLAGRPWSDIVEWRELVPLAFGDTRFRVETNLPAWSRDALRLIATLTFAANPPSRVQAVVRAVSLDPARPVADIGVRLGRNEAPRWSARVDAVLPGDGTIVRIGGETFDGAGTRIAIGPAQLPVVLARVAASSALCTLADVEITPVRADGAAAGEPVQLGAASTQGAACARKPAHDLRLNVVAHALGGGSLVLAPRPFGDTRVDLSDFPQYGTQTATFDVAFDAGPAAVAIETRTLDAADDAEAESVVFDVTRARRDIAWRCRDPFRCGLRWRWRAAIGEAPWPWSEPLSPGSETRLATGERRRAS